MAFRYGLGALGIALALTSTADVGLRAERGRVIHVDARASGADSGEGWDDAYRDLQAALAVAAPGDELWVAAGTYRPTAGRDRTVSFVLRDGVRVLGGFAGTETTREQRDPTSRMTLLSGDIGREDDDSDNSHHVVVADASVGPGAVLDGFVVSGGNAEEVGPIGGGGIYLAGSPTLRHLTVRDNRAEAGGGIYIDWGSPTIVRCSVVGNSARRGGGLYTRGGEVTAANVLAAANTAETGAGVFVESGRASLVNWTIGRNVAERSGGGLWIDGGAVVLANAIVWDNAAAAESQLGGLAPTILSSDVQGLAAGTGVGNLDADPQFVDAASGDFRLRAGSPAIDAGDNALVPDFAVVAVDGSPRVLADPTRPRSAPARVDMGAFEFDGSTPPAPGPDAEPTGPTSLLGGGPDSDGDGVPDEVDCRPLDSSVWAVPSPARELRLGGGAATALSWTAPSAPGGTSVLYDVLRSTNPADFSTAACIYANGAGSSTSDTALPTSAFQYLVRAKNACGGNLGPGRSGASCTIGTGQPCATDAACASGFCSDGVCCSSRCGGPCESCNQAGRLGLCDPISAGTDPDNECAAEPASTCGLTGQCNGARGCQLHASGTVCVPPSCASATQASLADTCNGSGGCVDGGLLDCSPYGCNATAGACRTSCTTHSHCAGGFSCRLATAQCLANDGASCTTNAQCFNDACCGDVCRNTANDVNHCGSCGLSCTNPNGTTACVGGSCSPGCSPGWGSCDGNPNNGCETPLNTLTNCGACGVPCSRANATATCSTGSCEIASCYSGFSNCDGNGANGCEVSHATASNTCASAVFVGTFDGDVSCGFICGSNTQWDLFSTRTGRTSMWFVARVREDSTCSARIEHQIRLTPPPGADYDLYVYRPCGTLVGSSTLGGGSVDVVTVSQSDTANDDSFDYWVEVRWFSGASCSNWTLQFFGHNC